LAQRQPGAFHATLRPGRPFRILRTGGAHGQRHTTMAAWNSDSNYHFDLAVLALRTRILKYKIFRVFLPRALFLRWRVRSITACYAA